MRDALLQTSETFIAIDQAAVQLGVPAAWLKREAAAGHIPSLVVGRRMLLNLEQVREALTALAAQSTQGGSR